MRKSLTIFLYFVSIATAYAHAESMIVLEGIISTVVENLLLILLLLMGAGIFKSRMDSAAELGIKSKESKNKWKLNDIGQFIYVTEFNKAPWWYMFYPKSIRPSKIERFPFSSTVLVFLTDTWHKNQFFFLRCMYGSIAVLLPFSFLIKLAATFVIFPIIVGLVFEYSRRNKL
jgi:hypothetical protein